ncbi:MAG: cation:dicarboxylase symporter family transporter, partial [Planctomycetaceae bacterium]|nr:cation:dicarboxylase symporter family transporter [Planctomycetaceae bacterium]
MNEQQSPSAESPPRLALHWQILIGMIAGAAVGLLLNLSLSTTDVARSEDIPTHLSKVELRDSTNTITITTLTHDNVETVYEIGGKLDAKYADLKSFKIDQPSLHAVFESHGQSWARQIGNLCKRLGGLFLRMLQMVAVPLIVTSLTVGVMGLGKAERLGRMFRRTMLYYICTSFLAIVTGLIMVN